MSKHYKNMGSFVTAIYDYIMTINTELANYALDQVHCWAAYFRHRIGHFENFTPLNFEPQLFPKAGRLVDRQCTLQPLVGKIIM